jgi:hypothetical protein
MDMGTIFSVNFSNLQFACGLHGLSNPFTIMSFAVIRHCRTESKSHEISE